MPASAHTVNVNYTEIPPTCYALTLGHTGQGGTPVASPANSTGCSTGQYVAGATINLSGAAPATGWHIAGWTGTQDDASTASTNTVTMPASAHAAGVTYAQDQYTLAITSLHGTVTKDPDKTTYTYNEVVQLTATPDAGWSFANWSGDASGTANPLSVTMDADKAITANYTQNEYTLSVNIVGNGAVNKSPDQATYHHGDLVQLSAVPDAGWQFSAWSGDASGTSSPVSVTMDGNKNVTATFSSGGSLTPLAPSGTLTDWDRVLQLDWSAGCHLVPAGSADKRRYTGPPQVVYQHSDGLLGRHSLLGHTSRTEPGQRRLQVAHYGLRRIRLWHQYGLPELHA